MNFIDFAAFHGLLIDRLIEGRWVRVKTTDHPKKRNGSYKFLGSVAFLQNHATMDRVAVWREKGESERIDRLELHRILRQSAKEELERHAEAAATADDMIRRAAFGVHPYLAMKGFPKENALILDGELLIPMREFRLYKQLNSVQRISPAGEKKFLYGGKAKGSVFFLGPYMARERWLVEGYATGLSVKAALREQYIDAQVIVCFSAANLAHVGRLVKGLRPPAYVFADNDASGAGEQAAKDTGLPWVMPGEGDANDMHLTQGLRALGEFMRTVRARAAVAA